nr:MAG TPA: tail tape measure protein [Caudoviricetes sp.]
MAKAAKTAKDTGNAVSTSSSAMESAMIKVPVAADKVAKGMENLGKSTTKASDGIDGVKKTTEETKKPLGEIPPLTQKVKSAFEKLSESVTKQASDLDELKAKYASLYLEQGEESAEAQEVARQITELSTSLGENKAKISEAVDAANKFDTTMHDTSEAVDDVAEAVEDAGDKTNLFADILKANLASGAIIAGVKKLAGVVADVGKAAYTSYARYEQLASGAQLMFGDAYDFVAEKARNAYKTVQMSQNDYFQQVNGFATGLKTALGGNVQAAAELADKVITAEADVVAATGNTQEAVQNAFNGIMKSNYTMLDNLQLGITPTKEGFQQLIDTVNEWNAENGEATAYTIDNLADCQAALVDYIEMQGLSNYAAEEAARTIEGSTASMKAAWQNLATGMADSNADMEGLTQDFVDSVFTAGKNIVPRVQQIVTGVGTATVEAISYLRETNSAIDLLVTAFEFAATAATVAGTAIGVNMAGKAIANIATIFTANASALAFFTAESGKAAVAEATLNGVFSVSEIAVGVLTGKISLATAAQYAWNTAIAANPLGVLAAAVAALAIGIGKATKAHKEFVKELAGEPQTVEEARAKVEELKKQYEEASKARLEMFSSDAGFSGDTVEMERLAEAIKQAEQNLANLQAQEQAAAEEAAKPANVIKAASEEYAAAAQSILEDYQNTYTTIYNGLHDAGSAFTSVVEATEISWADAMANINANTAVLDNMDENFAIISAAANDAGVNIDGFSQYLASMSTEDAAGVLAALRTELDNVEWGSADATVLFDNLATSINKYAESGTGYADGLALAVENVKSRMQEAADSYVEKVGDLDQEAAATEAATNTMSGLVAGIDSSTPGVLDKMDSLASQMKSRLTNSFSGFVLTINAKVKGSNVPGAKSGLDYVPYDDYLVRLHKGEKVLTAEEARAYRAGKSAGASGGADYDGAGFAGGGRGVTIIQNINSPVQSEVELAAATEAYFTQARWTI